MLDEAEMNMSAIYTLYDHMRECSVKVKALI